MGEDPPYLCKFLGVLKAELAITDGEDVKVLQGQRLRHDLLVNFGGVDLTQVLKKDLWSSQDWSRSCMVVIIVV